MLQQAYGMPGTMKMRPYCLESVECLTKRTLPTQTSHSMQSSNLLIVYMAISGQPSFQNVAQPQHMYTTTLQTQKQTSTLLWRSHFEWSQTLSAALHARSSTPSSMHSSTA